MIILVTLLIANKSLQVQSAEVVYERDSNRSKGFGFVVFGSQEEADAAKEGLNNQVSFPLLFIPFLFPCTFFLFFFPSFYCLFF